jgi:glycosyltransferase involved in cell wall biosynthesis
MGATAFSQDCRQCRGACVLTDEMKALGADEISRNLCVDRRRAVEELVQKHSDSLVQYLRRQTDDLWDVYFRLDRACNNAQNASQWVRLNIAAKQSGFSRYVVRRAAVRIQHEPRGRERVKVPQDHAYRYISLLNSERATVGLDPDDPVIKVVEGDATSEYATRGVRVQWSVPCDCCGFSVEAGWIMDGVRRFIETRSPVTPICYCRGLRRSTSEALWDTFQLADERFHQPTLRAIRADEFDVVDVNVYHWDPVHGSRLRFGRTPSNDYHIMRTMYEFNKIPSAWVPLLSNNRYDEIWVPAEAVREAFISSGVPASKLQIMREPVDVMTFNPEANTPIELPASNWRSATSDMLRSRLELRKNLKFCSVFKLEPRKGWDALIRAFLTAFSAKDRVSLYISTIYWSPAMPVGVKDHRDPQSMRYLIESVAASMGLFERQNLPHIEVMTEELSENDMVRFYRACDAFALPSRGEGWGLPIIQAMSMALPTITTRHSGMLEFTTSDTVLYVNVSLDELPDDVRKSYSLPEGSVWGEPDLDHLIAQLKRVVNMTKQERAALGARARAHIVEHFAPEVIGKQIAERVKVIEGIVRERWQREGRPAGKPKWSEPSLPHATVRDDATTTPPPSVLDRAE